MPLTLKDIERIQKLGYDFNEFTVQKNGWRLKNSSKKCVFLSEKGCSIYTDRPEGCKLYPLVFDEAYNRVTMDILCPFRNEFSVEHSDIKKLLRILREF